MEIKDNRIISVSDEDIVNGVFKVPSNIYCIGDDAFKNNMLIKKVELTSSVTQIGARAFLGCKSLTQINLKNVKKIDASAFCDCVNLDNIELSNELTIIDSDCFNGCVSLQKLTLPKNIKIIYDGAFAECKNLNCVSFNDLLTEISIDAFYNCDSLTKLTFPDNLKSILFQSFANCKKLRSVVIPKNVEIEDRAFYNCPIEYVNNKKVEIFSNDVTCDIKNFLKNI